MKNNKIIEPRVTEEEEKAGRDALDACYTYWKLYTAREAKRSNYNTAVIWIQDNENGHFFCFSRGEYVQQIKDSVNRLNFSDK